MMMFSRNHLPRWFSTKINDQQSWTEKQHIFHPIFDVSDLLHSFYFRIILLECVDFNKAIA